MKKKVLGDKKTLKDFDLVDIVSEKVARKSDAGVLLTEIRERENVRKKYNSESIQNLAGTIKEEGLIQPVVVQKNKNDGTYILIVGHRRYRAYCYLNKEYPGEYRSIKAVILDEDENIDDERLKIIQVIENFHRENLTANEMREFLTYLRKQGLSNKEIAEKIKMKEGTVKHIFSSIKTLDKNPELSELVESEAGVTFADLQEIKPLPSKQQIQLLEKKINGTIKTREELREKVRELRNQLSDKNTQNYKAKQSYDIVTYKEDKVKVKSFSYDFKKTTPDQTKKLVDMLQDLITRIQGGAK